MTTNQDRAAEYSPLRPPPSDRYDNTMNGLPSFSRHEDSAVDGPHIEASVTTRYRKNIKAILANVTLDIDGDHGTTYTSAHVSPEWCREAAAILLDVADAVEVAQKDQEEQV